MATDRATKDMVYIIKYKKIKQTPIKNNLPIHLQPEDLGHAECMKHAEFLIDGYVPSNIEFIRRLK